MAVVETAPAKINLYLHVGPLRADGLHDLASLFVFADVGDVITARPASDLSLDVTGPFAGPLLGEDLSRNLVLRAARALRAETGVEAGAALTLDKRLPIAAGIGGGSADAAAALRALVRLWKVDLSDDALSRLAFRLGADVPACLAAAPVYVTGAGEIITTGPILPPLWVCLVNPLTPTPTGPIFRAFDSANPNPPTPFLTRPASPDAAAFNFAMDASRNDLEPHAVVRAPIVSDVISYLKSRPGARSARMSGSGATCFALFSSREAATRAARAARAFGWWSASARILSGRD
ncbi:MAG: 4-(cytidine 5'-diphospho)-2-C-methyl-D-erythritol kinase [Pseudomonadota bacterium]